MGNLGDEARRVGEFLFGDKTQGDPDFEGAGPLDDLEPSSSRYIERQVIGQGGMAVVDRAYDTVLKREVAIKTLGERLSNSPSAAQRFRIEAERTGQLDHPNIIPVYDVGLQDDGRPYISMKLVRGEPLSAILERISNEDEEAVQNYPLNVLLSLFLKVLDAVAFAHSKGVIHRDLKPSNIMIGEYGEVLVADWGLAKRFIEEDEQDDTAGACQPKDEGAPLTHDGAVVGTPAYMAPEQARGDVSDVDSSSDVYSLGAILYEILSLAPAFDGEAIQEILNSACAGEITPPSGRGTTPWQVPPEIEVVVMKAMSKEKSDRYVSVDAIISEMDAYLSGRTLASVSYSPISRISKLIRRNPRVSLVSLSALAILLAMGVLSYIQIDEERKIAVKNAEIAEREAERARESEKQADVAKTVALDARDQHEQLISDLLYKLKEKLDPLGKLDILEDVARKAYEQLRADSSIFENDSSRLRLRANALKILGDIFREQGMYHKAEESYNTSLSHLAKRPPDNLDNKREIAVIHSNLGKIYQDQGNLAEALNEYTLAGGMHDGGHSGPCDERWGAAST